MLLRTISRQVWREAAAREATGEPGAEERLSLLSGTVCRRQSYLLSLDKRAEVKVDRARTVGMSVHELAVATDAFRAIVSEMPSPSVLTHLCDVANGVKRALDLLCRPEPYQRRGEWLVIAGTTYGLSVVHRYKFAVLEHPWSGVKICLAYL